jgi:arylesterase/paraoxonase
MRRGLFLLLAAGVLLLTLAALVVGTYRDAGEFLDLSYQAFGSGRRIPLPQGSEDIAVDHRTGTAYISSADFRAIKAQPSTARGELYTFDLENPEAKPVALTRDWKPSFNPHGLGLWPLAEGGVRLFVINHTPAGHFVEVFDHQGGRLIHRQSLSDPLMHAPNDLLPVGPDRFYVTNDHGYRSDLGRTLEDFLQLSEAEILYHDGRTFRVAAKGLAYANGLGLSPEGRILYAAETIGRRLAVYDREPSSGALFFRRRIDMGTGVDNIDVDAEGNLWIGAHPKLLTFVKHSKNASLRSPSQILKFTPAGPEGYVFGTEHLSDGTDLSGASVGVRYKNKLVLGAVFDPGFLILTRQP